MQTLVASIFAGFCTIFRSQGPGQAETALQGLGFKV